MDNTCQDKVVDICEVTSSVTVRKLSRGLLVRSVGRNHFIYPLIFFLLLEG